MPPTFDPVEVITANWSAIPKGFFTTPKPVKVMKELSIEMKVGGGTATTKVPAGGTVYVVSQEGPMLTITTHVLDLTIGSPAAGVPVTLEREDRGAWESHGHALTDTDSRVHVAFAGLSGPGRFRLTFGTGAYFAGRGIPCFHPVVMVVFEVREARHHHVPLLLSPFGYSTYRGSCRARRHPGRVRPSRESPGGRAARPCRAA